MGDLKPLSAPTSPRASRRRHFTAEAVVRTAFDRIAAREPPVQASPPRSRLCADAGTRAGPHAVVARAMPRRADRREGHHRHRTPADRDGLAYLQGQPLGRRRRPAARSRAWRRGDPRQDRDAEFAGMSPGPTANPQNPAHTPGGSSSGLRRGESPTHGAVPTVLRPADRCCAPRLLRMRGYKPHSLIKRKGHQVRSRNARHHWCSASPARSTTPSSSYVGADQPAAFIPAARSAAAPRPLLARRCGDNRRRLPPSTRSEDEASSSPPDGASVKEICCRSNSRSLFTPRARPSTITNARRDAPTGSIIRTRQARCGRSA